MRRWCREASVLWRRNGDRILLLPSGAEEALLLEGVSAALWEALASPAHTDELVEPLAEVFDGAPERIEADLVAFLEQLHGRGVLNVTQVA